MKTKWPVIGHRAQLEQLEHDLENDRLSHAYLFCGPSQIGKTRVARTLAQILQCPNRFCRECATCQQIENGQHIDTFERLDQGESMKIEEMRDLLTHLSTTSSSSYKIVIFQNVERLTNEATNALLKNLEEPVKGVIFLMTTSRRQALLDTLLSRSRVMNFHVLPEAELREHLHTLKSDLDDVDLKLMAGFSMGKVGRALEFLNDPDRFRFYQDMYHQIAKFLEHSSLTDRMLYAEEIAKTPDSVDVFFELFHHILRGLILKKTEGEQISYRFEDLFAIVEYLNKARFELDHNVNARMVLENLMMKI